MGFISSAFRGQMKWPQPILPVG